MTRRINMRSVQNAEAYRHSGAWAGGTIADDARRLV
jgi:hypothetical protein